MGTYLITGIGRGIGRELARALLQRGDRVVGTLRDLGKIPSEWSDVIAGRQLRLLALDVRDGASIREAAASLDEPIDVLVNNAGIIGPQRQSTLDMDFEGFLETLNVNTLGPLRVIQAFLPHLRRAKAAKIITISSRMGSLSHAKSDRIAYRASKAAVNKVIQGVATDLQPEGIISVSVHPGWVQTDMGGPRALITAEQSVSGLRDVIDGLTRESSGAFLDYQGKTIPW